MKKIDIFMIVFVLLIVLGTYMYSGIKDVGTVLVMIGIMGILLFPIYLDLREEN